MSGRWVQGNRFRLLENGEEFFPRAFEAIGAAREEVLLETFILFDDKVGRQLHAALIKAARQGAQVDVTVDGWGSAFLPEAFVAELAQAGVRVHVFDPGHRIFSWRTNMFRRMHRKILVVDGNRAFVGGINYSADHLADFGAEAKQDYSVEIEGPIVQTIRQFARATPRVGQPRRRWLQRTHEAAKDPALPRAGDAQAMFVTRDNRDHRTDIERHYRAAIRLARDRVLIANAYFFPGYRLLKEMRKAARRGVDVRLILQGEPDMAIVKTAASLLYNHLLRAGVKIYEYTDRPLHGKVAVIDDEWSTVGSSNLDPLSLSLNLEANVMIRDRAFNRHLGERLEALISESCRLIEAKELPHANTWLVVRSFFVFHFLRHFPSWASSLPAHAPKIRSIDAGLVRRIVEGVVRDHDERSLTGVVAPVADADALVGELVARVSGFGPLQPYLDDPAVEEIWINDPSRIFIARNGRHELTNLMLSTAQVQELVERMLKSSGRRIDVSQPFVDAMLPEGHRLHVVLEGISRGFSAVKTAVHFGDDTVRVVSVIGVLGSIGWLRCRGR